MSEEFDEGHTTVETESHALKRSVNEEITDMVKAQQSVDDRKRTKTLALFVGYFHLGLVIAILGPTIPDLLYQVNANYDKLSYMFLSRGFGYMTGSIMTGLLLDRINPFGLLGAFLALCSVGSLCIPATSNIAILLAVFVVYGTPMGGLDTGINVLCLRMWGERSPPYMQALHVMFAVGACTAPLIASPFISSFAINECDESSFNTELTSNLTHIANVPSTNTRIKIDRFQNNISTLIGSTPHMIYLGHSIVEIAANDSLKRGEDTPIIVEDDNNFENIDELGNIFTVYGIIAATTFATSIIYFYFCFTSHHKCINRQTTKHTPLNMKTLKDTSNDKWFRVQMLSVLFVFYFLYIGCEVGFGGYIYSYAINCDLKFSKGRASLLNSIFWGSFAAFRGLSIVLAYVFTPLQMLLTDVITCIGASVILTLFANTSHIAIWSGTAIFGAGLASLFPAGFSWLEQYIQVSGRHAAILTVGASFGEMILPFAVGQYFPDDNNGCKPSSKDTTRNINALMYLILVISCVKFILILIAYKLASRKGNRYCKKEDGNKAIM